MFEIAVIGCGVIGIPTAIAIQKKLGPSAKVTIFAESVSPNTTGDIAAGLWTPYLLQDTPYDVITKWSKATQDYILQLWQEGKAKEAGISFQSVVKLSTDPNYRKPDWADLCLGHTVLSSQQLAKYSKRYKEHFTGGLAYVAFTWEAAFFLPYLFKKFEANGGQFVQRKITDFEMLANFDVIVNCCGLGARNLVEDNMLRPIRGQIARVQAPMQLHCLMIENEDGKYIIPNQKCVILGGTHQIDNYNLKICQKDAKQILNGCYAYAPLLAKGPILGHMAGLRPGRDKVRLELETRQIKGQSVNIVHNYGHGGSGITLSIGCAESAADLVSEALLCNCKSKL